MTRSYDEMATRLAVGRPRADSEQTGPSRQFRVRASDAIYGAVTSPRP